MATVEKPMTTAAGDFQWPSGQVIYLDSCSWTELFRHPKSALLVEKLRDRDITILASVLNAAEVAVIPLEPDPLDRRNQCFFLKGLAFPGLLEHPLLMAKPLAEGILRGEESYPVPETQLSQQISTFMADPADEATRQEILDWHKKIELTLKTVSSTVASLTSDLQKALVDQGSSTKLADLDLVTRDAARSPFILKALLAVAAQMDLKISEDQMRAIIDKPFPTIWSGLTGIWLFEVQQRARGIGKKHRPGAFDLLQTLYMTLPLHAFVTDDGDDPRGETRLLAAAKSVSRILQVPCPVLTSTELFEILLTGKALPQRT